MLVGFAENLSAIITARTKEITRFQVDQMSRRV